MQCGCVLSEDGKSFVTLCEDHYALKVRAMARERDYCKEMIRGLVTLCSEDDGEYQTGLEDAIGAIDDMEQSESLLDAH